MSHEPYLEAQPGDTRMVPTHDTPAAQAFRQLHPHKGWCFRCGFPWMVVIPHVTNYTDKNGCFPLCLECWDLLGCPEARIEYYKMLIDHWELGNEVTEEEARLIQRAVANGK